MATWVMGAWVLGADSSQSGPLSAWLCSLGALMVRFSLQWRDLGVSGGNVCKALSTAPGTHRAPPKAASFGNIPQAYVGHRPG